MGKVFAVCQLPPSCRFHDASFRTGGFALLWLGWKVKKALVGPSLAAAKYSRVQFALYHGATAMRA